MHRFLVLALTLLLLPATAHAGVPEGATWTETYIDDGDGPKLHADVLRPAHLPEDAPTPVILTVSPYTNHSAEATNPKSPPWGPSDRFADFYNGAKLFERGYTYVIVDLRGFGGSGGCNDWGGPGEQADVKRAVEWVANQKWSNGRVGMYGKSYDAWTGLMGIAQNPSGLAGVVAQEPVYSGYRYLYTNGVRFSNSVATPTLFSAIDASPGAPNDTPEYHLNGNTANVDRPGCHVLNVTDQGLDDREDSEFWKARDLIPHMDGKTTPLFLTQGYLEGNTKPDGAFDVLDAVDGPKRAWFGPWDHVRGNETDADGRLQMGRAGWFDEVMRFYDRYVRGLPPAEAPTHADPAIAVEGSDGRWREEAAWPPADAQRLGADLLGGTYTDDGENQGSGADGGNGLWTFSPPLAHRAQLAGEPVVTLDLNDADERANVVANVYDVDPEGNATLVSRGATLAGRTKTVTLYGNDWSFEPGHRVGVLLSSANSEWWEHVPTHTDVEVRAAGVALPWLTYARDAQIQGDPAPNLETYKDEAPFAVDPATIEERTNPGFTLPGPLQQRPQPTGDEPAPPAETAAAPSALTPRKRALGALTVRLGRVRGAFVAAGSAPQGTRVLVRLQRGGRTVAARRVTARYGAFRVRLRARRAGRYRVAASTRLDGTALRARSGTLRIRR